MKTVRKIWVDADACPGVIKEVLFRAAKRTGREYHSFTKELDAAERLRKALELILTVATGEPTRSDRPDVTPLPHEQQGSTKGGEASASS